MELINVLDFSPLFSAMLSGAKQGEDTLGALIEKVISCVLNAVGEFLGIFPTVGDCDIRAEIFRMAHEQEGGLLEDVDQCAYDI